MEIARQAQTGLAHTRELVRRYGQDAMACQILNPGIVHWHSADGNAALGYVPAGGYRVVAGSPLCEPLRLSSVTTTFETEAHQEGRRVCYFGVGSSFLDTLRITPAARMLLGAQPIWDPTRWPTLLKHHASLRSQIRRLTPRLRVEVWDPLRAGASAELARCRREWLATRNLPPMRFVVETDVFERLEGRRVYVAEQNNQPVAFLVAVPVPSRSGWLIDQMIRGAKAPNGTIELLIDAAMHDLAASGAQWVSLGLSPLSTRAGSSGANHPYWLRITLGMVRRFGRPLYNFEGLDAFKARLRPDHWEPMYAVDPQGIRPGTLYAIAAAFGGTAPALFVAQALIRIALRRR
jgi:phosphatidylglycerol lysyltransferase